MTFYVFRPAKSRLWSGRYRLSHETRITTIALGCTNKSVAFRKLQDLVDEKEREHCGILSPQSVRDAAQRRLSEHLGEFIDSKTATRDEKYLREVKKRALKLINDCRWKTAKDIAPESFQRWRSNASLSVKTLNEYLTSIRTLLNWMVKRGRISVNPLNCVEMLPKTGAPVRPRRAFSDDEMRRLLAVAGERRVVYLVAVFTGLRRSELEGIRLVDLIFEGDAVRVVARASITKNHREARIRYIPWPPQLCWST